MNMKPINYDHWTEEQKDLYSIKKRVEELERLQRGRENWVTEYLIPQINKIKKKITNLSDTTGNLRIDFARHKEGLDTYEELYSQLKKLE